MLYMIANVQSATYYTHILLPKIFFHYLVIYIFSEIRPQKYLILHFGICVHARNVYKYIGIMLIFTRSTIKSQAKNEMLIKSNLKNAMETNLYHLKPLDSTLFNLFLMLKDTNNGHILYIIEIQLMLNCITILLL